MKVIKVSDETYRRLVVIRGEMEKKGGRIMSMDRVIQSILDKLEKASKVSFV